MTQRKKRGRTAVGKELAKIRIDTDETIGQMAKKIGYHPVHLSKIESGVNNFTIEMAMSIKEQYGVDLTHLVGEGRQKLSFTVDELTPEELEILIGIRNQISLRKNGHKDAVAQTKSDDNAKTAPSVPDVAGVDFIDD